MFFCKLQSVKQSLFILWKETIYIFPNQEFDTLVGKNENGLIVKLTCFSPFYTCFVLKENQSLVKLKENI